MKSTKLILLVTLHFFAALHLNSAEVNLRQALEKAQQFMPDRTFRLSASAKSTQNDDGSDTHAYYVFNSDDNMGYVIVSGDDRARTILGYAEQGNLDTSDLPDNLKWWLSNYEQQINSLTKNDVSAAMHKDEVEVFYRGNITPFMSTTWDQHKPYNDMCPAINGQQCVTGCVATALAQVMKFYNWPQEPAGSYSYVWRDKDTLTVNFDGVTYEWTNMRNTYSPFEEYSGTEASAVAKLMYHCGVISNMDYGLIESGGTYSLQTLAANFRYHCEQAFSIEGNYHGEYTINELKELIYADLQESHPVLMEGHNYVTGHAFICHGYENRNDEDYFYMNWGWGGHCDGYYALTAMKPLDEYKYNFSFDIGIIYNITPNYGPVVYESFNEDDGTLTISAGEKPEGDTVYISGSRQPWDDINQKIKKVIIEPSVQEAEISYVKRIFSWCSELEDITGMEYLNTAFAADMSSMFQGCHRLTSLDLRNFDTSKIRSMNGMFEWCESLKTLYVNAEFASEIFSGHNKDIFHGVSDLKVYVPEEDYEYVKSTFYDKLGFTDANGSIVPYSASGITDINTPTRINRSSYIYSINGMRINTDTNSDCTSGRLYIVGGKKILCPPHIGKQQ